MIQNQPTYIVVSFILTTVVTLFLFYGIIRISDSEKIRKKSNPILIGSIIWLIAQMVLTLDHYYSQNLSASPPKLFLFGILPPLLLIILLVATRKGREFIDSLPLKNITYLNIIRIPVELVLYWLLIQKSVPELMTFEGRNFDILSGITAPFVGYYVFTKRKLSNGFLLIWNFIGLGLLINIVTHALFSAPFPIQKLAFEQPNIAILNFPFSWLPTFIVPVVLFGHLVSIRQLIIKKNFKLWID